LKVNDFHNFILVNDYLPYSRNNRYVRNQVIFFEQNQQTMMSRVNSPSSKHYDGSWKCERTWQRVIKPDAYIHS